jgi:hypothetical protein
VSWLYLFVAVLWGVAIGLHLAPVPAYVPPREWMPPAVHERPLELLHLTHPLCPRP